MSILRRHVRDSYTVVPNAVLEDSRLSWAARGVMAYLLSKPDGWNIFEAHLVRASEAPRTGLDAVRSHLRELEMAGYLRRGWEVGDSGLRRRVTEISDQPLEEWSNLAKEAENKGLTDSGLTDVGETAIGLPNALVSTETSNGLKPVTTDPRLLSTREAIWRWLGYPADGKGAQKHVHIQVANLARMYIVDGENELHALADSEAWFQDDWRGRKDERPGSVGVAQEFRAKRRAGAPTPARRPGAHVPGRVYQAADPTALEAARLALANGNVGDILWGQDHG